MKTCENCFHEVRRVKGQLLHRRWHHLPGAAGGGPTFNLRCTNRKSDGEMCRCENPKEYK